jgi:hypothetical protein
MKRFSFLSSVLLPISCLFSNPSNFYNSTPSHEQQINYHNRPLIKINGKTISLVDVIKRLDMQILKNAPYILNDVQAKHQYYASNWRFAFNELVEQELVLLDAEALKFTISEGDIREDLESSLGSNLISKLDLIGVTLEEAKKMTENEMIVRQMLWFKAYSKALQAVTPEAIKLAYTEALIKEQLNQKEQWCYQVLTVKCKDPHKAEKVANEAYQLLQNSSVMASIPDVLKNTIGAKSVNPDFEVTISKDIVVDNQSVSKAHFEILSSLHENEYSKPICQQLKNSKETVQRIFHLKNHTKQEVKKFEELASTIKDKLTQASADKEKKIYIDILKEKYLVTDQEITEVIPKDYDPFALI